ncbi:MAG: cysteine--tRNA ligase [Chloroflexi bacterium]|nr:cysteine--tRNA ligase [Chloroflexota bacterium]
MKVYNTLSGSKEEFVPQGDPVRLYVCGVTPYDDCHIGHAMSFILFDVIRRYLEFQGYNVRHVQNFTDIDDKIIQRATLLEITPQELAEAHIAQYFADMDALNVQRAHVYPRATEEVPRIIEVVSGLITAGHAYQAGGDVYFRVTSFKDYGQLSGRTLEGMMAGARIEVDPAKEHPMDFVLWKGAKPGEPQWHSPWGPGRPGWHIECTAMSLHYLGQTLDIHGGGQDLIFPHHENEIAQSEAYTGVKPFAHFWLHNGMLQRGEEKMSKSLGNFITVKEALARFSADAIRLFVLSSHYRSPLTYSEESLTAMERAAERLRYATNGGEGNGDSASAFVVDDYRHRFVEAMDDDFNTPQGLAVLFDLAREINRQREKGMEVSLAQATLRELAGVLGLSLEERKREYAAVEPFIQLLVDIRRQLRAIKQWELADDVRTRLRQLGVALEDTPQGTVWKYRG